MQPFPNTTRAFGDVSLPTTKMVDLEIVVGAVAEEFRAARPEVGEPGNVLFGVKVVVLWNWITF